MNQTNENIHSSDIICVNEINVTKDDSFSTKNNKNDSVLLKKDEYQNTSECIQNDLLDELESKESSFNLSQKNILGESYNRNKLDFEDSVVENNKLKSELSANLSLNCNSESRNGNLFYEGSTSILEIPSFLKNKLQNNEKVTNKSEEADKNKNSECIPSFYDPIFHNLRFEIPSCMEYILKKQDIIPFSYSIQHLDTKFRIIKGGKEIFICDVKNYDEKCIPCENSKNIIFITKQRSFVQKEKNKESKRYKKCLSEKTKYIKNDIIKKTRLDIFKKQIEKGINVVFLEDYNDLFINLKSIVKNLFENKEIVPKVKTFNENGQKEHFEYVLSSIPGISKNVASSVVNNFKSLSNFYRLVKSEKIAIEKLVSLKVTNEDNTTSRTINVKQAKLISSALLEDDPEVYFKNINE